MAPDERKGSDVDIYRDTPVRLLGYANEVGEAFRVWVRPVWVRLSYGVASVYVLADTYDKASKASQLGVVGDDAVDSVYIMADTHGKTNERSSADRGRVVRVAVDTLLWQTLASVVIPGFTINRLCALTFWALGRRRVAEVARKRLTTAAGLGSIPFIVKPIDALVDWSMDRSVRRVLNVKTHVDTKLK